ATWNPGRVATMILDARGISSAIIRRRRATRWPDSWPRRLGRSTGWAAPRRSITGNPPHGRQYPPRPALWAAAPPERPDQPGPARGRLPGLDARQVPSAG